MLSHLQFILKTDYLSLIVLFTQSVSGELSFGKTLSAAAVWSSPSPCYFSAVSVMLWTMAQTPMQCDRVVPLRFPNQVSSPLPIPLFSAFTENQCFGRELCAKDSRPCLCWMWAKSLFYLPSFPIWDGCCKVAKCRGSHYPASKRLLRLSITSSSTVGDTERYSRYARKAKN